MGSHIYLLVNIHTGDDKEDPRPSGSSCEEATQSEDDSSLVLLIIIVTILSPGLNSPPSYLDNFDDEYEAEGEGGHYQHQREYGESQGADPRSFLAGCRAEE